MHQESQNTPQMSSTLSQSFGQYNDVHVSDHQIVTPNTIQQAVIDFVQSHILSQGTVGIAFIGLPAAGKSKGVSAIQEAAQSAVGFQSPESHTIYRNPEGKLIEIGGHTCLVSNASVTLVHADHFFGAIGTDRRGDMLKNTQSCQRLWGDPGSALKAMRAHHAGESTNVSIYTGTVDEKIKRARQGTIELLNHTQQTVKNVIISEGVNVGEWADRITKMTSIKTLKILYNMSVEDSLTFVLRRDHDKKGYSFQEILQERLLEYYYIFDLYLLPALRDPSTLLFNKSREMPLFTGVEKSEIIAALSIMRAKYVGNNSTLTPQQIRFIDNFSSGMIMQFDQIKSATPEEIQVRNQEKLQRKTSNFPA